MASNLYIAENNEIVQLVQPLKYGGTIKNQRVELEYFLHDYLADKSDFMLFIRVLNIIFNDIKSVANDFENLADVNNVVNIFLPKLSYLMNYTFRYDLPDDINRDIIKRLLYIYKHKGTDKEVLEAADFANNDNWIANTLFVPTSKNPTPVPDDRTASLFYPIDKLFTWDKSAYSISDRYGDSTRWRDGVIVVEAENVNKSVRDAIRRVLPAGLKCYYESKSELKADGENEEPIGYGKSLKYTEWILYLRYTLDYFLRLDNLVSSDKWSEDNINYPFIWSGRQILFPYYELDKIFVASMLTLYKEEVLDIFYFLKQLEASIPVGLAYSADKNIQQSIDIINITRDIDGLTYSIETKDTASPMIFNQTIFNGTTFNTTATEEYLKIDETINKIEITSNSNLLQWSKTSYSGRFVINPELESNSEEFIDSEFGVVLKNLTQTEILSFYRNLLFSKYMQYFSLWTDKPIHDIDTYQIQSPVLTKTWRGFPRYDRNFGYSGKYALSGLSNTLYIQAKYEYIYPDDNHYPVSDILNRIPPVSDYSSDNLDSLGKLDEQMRIDIHIFKRMEYRGRIDMEFYNNESGVFLDSRLSDTIGLWDGMGNNITKKYLEVKLLDLIRNNNSIEDTFLRRDKEETLFDVFLSDYCIIENSEPVLFEELKLGYVFQHKDFVTRTKIMELTLKVPYGHLRYILYNGIDNQRYLEEHENQNRIDVNYETDYGIRPIEKSLLFERLVDTEEKDTGIDYKTIYRRKLNDKYLNDLDFKGIKLSTEVYSFNMIYEMEGRELMLSLVVYPNQNHNTTRLEEEYLTSKYGRYSIKDITLSGFIKVLENVV